MSNFTLHRRAEWAPQSKTILSWASPEGTLKDYPDRLAKATDELSSIASAIAHFQPVVVAVEEKRHDEAQSHFASVETPFPITIHRFEGGNIDIWSRDIAPTFVIKEGPGADRSLVGLDWNFNGWGGKSSTSATIGFAQKYLQDVDIERIKSSIVTEGGSLEVDGDGTVLATESSIINDNRNPGKSREDIEAELKRTLGIEKVIWIPGRKNIDSTDGHIDALVRFIRPGVVVVSKANEVERTAWTEVYEEAVEILSYANDAKGRPLEIIEVEEPDAELFPGGGFEDNRPVRSYVNYTLVNGGVIIPQFGDPAHDAAGIIAFQRLYGDERRLYPVLIDELPRLGSGIHSSTQEIPQFP